MVKISYTREQIIKKTCGGGFFKQTLELFQGEFDPPPSPPNPPTLAPNQPGRIYFTSPTTQAIAYSLECERLIARLFKPKSLA